MTRKPPKLPPIAKETWDVIVAARQVGKSDFLHARQRSIMPYTEGTIQAWAWNAGFTQHLAGPQQLWEEWNEAINKGEKK